MSFALSTCVLLISLMQLLVLFASASGAAVLLTVIVHLTRIYTSL